MPITSRHFASIPDTDRIQSYKNLWTCIGVKLSIQFMFSVIFRVPSRTLHASISSTNSNPGTIFCILRNSAFKDLTIVDTSQGIDGR
jgi:hypothetical protein